MGRKIKKMCSGIVDAFDFLFKGSASNHLRISKTQPGKFRSYTQLKRYQRHFRKVVLELFVATVFLFIGILFGPVVFQDQFKSEIFIPDGKGDIVIGNVSRNQATVIFKTLDARNNNKPLATSAMVEIYLDPNFTDLYRKTEVFEYDVTHIIPLNGLQEGKYYYLKLLASESPDMLNVREVTRWAGKDPIAVYTAGEVISDCAISQNASRSIDSKENFSLQDSQKVEEPVQVAQSSEESLLENPAPALIKREPLKIGVVQNENYLHGNDKIQTIISWETNIPSDSSLIYRSEKDGNDIEIKRSGEMGKKHAVILTTFKPETVYYFKVKSKTEDGEIAVSNEYSMRTPRQKQTIFGMIGDNLKSLIGK